MAEVGGEQMRQVEKMVLLYTLDNLWREHIVNMEHLREVIHLRGYGQRDPLNEYKSESFSLFEGLLNNLRTAVTGQLMHVQISQPEPALQPQELPPLSVHHINPQTGEDDLGSGDVSVDSGMRGRNLRDDEGDNALATMLAAPKAEPVRVRKAAHVDPKNPATWGKVSRNESCPCGSGKKYKHCHGKLD